jgi:O-glycosyl hydrolase
MTPDTKSSIQLDELNILIADQKGLTLEQLAITEGEAIIVEPNAPATQNKWDKAREDRATAKSIKEEAEIVASIALSPAEMRSRADALYKEAARLRKEADAVDPPKKKTKVEA